MIEYANFIFFDWNGTIQKQSGMTKEEKLSKRVARLFQKFESKLGHLDFASFQKVFTTLKNDKGETTEFLGNGVVVEKALRHFGVELDSKIIEEMIAVFHGDEDEECPYELFPQAPSTLATLKRRGFRLGLIRNSKMPESSMRARLTQLGVNHYFDVVVMSGDVGYEKPHPRIFEEAVKKANVDDVHPSSIVFIGNETSVDVVGALRMGWRSVLVTHTEASSNGAAHHDIEHLHQLLSLLPHNTIIQEDQLC